MRLSNNAPFRLKDVTQMWRREHQLSNHTIESYQLWSSRFAEYCQSRGLDQRAELTELGVRKFARWWRFQKSRRGRSRGNIRHLHAALHSWASSLAMLKESMAQWRSSSAPPKCYASLHAFAEYLRATRGNGSGTIHRALWMIAAFEQYRRSRGRSGQPIRLSDIDAYIIARRHRFARRTILAICSTIRTYLRFLHITGQIDTDLSASVISPTIRPAERPYPVLPWHDVQQILNSIDRTRPNGRRDYALLLMMSVYGLGAGEVIRLRLDDVDWRNCTIHAVRQKTSVEFLLPLLPAVSRALIDYITHGRPQHAIERNIFLAVRTPYTHLTTSAVEQILKAAARRAGVTAPFLGSHVLRHTHASRQVDLGTPVKIIGDILGHRDPRSTSVYIRVAGERLREISLPVPT